MLSGLIQITVTSSIVRERLQGVLLFVISVRPKCSPLLLFPGQCTYLLNIPDIPMERENPSFRDLPSARE